METRTVLFRAIKTREGDMKLVAIEMSRLTALFQISRLRGGLYIPHATAEIAKRYKFWRVPNSFEDTEGGKLEFRHGVFGDIAIDALELYNDGIIVASRSDSKLVDEFLTDFISWIEQNLGISTRKSHSVNKMYESTVIVESDKDILLPLKPYAEAGRMLEDKLHESSGLRVRYESFGFTLAADHTKIPTMKPVLFRVERKADANFSLNCFFFCCAA